MGEPVRLFWAFDPKGKGPPYGPWREGERWGETYARVNNLIVVGVFGELRTETEVCTCPNISVGAIGDADRDRTVKGRDPKCPEHGREAR